ncbi:MAG: hypothetical protein JNL06_06545 [Alphaproteobacteria bacterium]|nr:hypothetical protein [Alphaproteobacteria bacterium]
MTNPLKTNTVRGSAAAATPGSWLFPPVLVPVLLTLMIGARAVYLALLS